MPAEPSMMQGRGEKQTSDEVTAVIRARGAAGSELDSSNCGGEKWSDSGCTLNLEPVGFPYT